MRVMRVIIMRVIRVITAGLAQEENADANGEDRTMSVRECASSVRESVRVYERECM